MKRKIISIIIACGMLVTYSLPAAFAETSAPADDPDTEIAEETVKLPADAADNDALLWMYLDEELKDGEGSPAGLPGTDENMQAFPQGASRDAAKNLSANSRKLFNALKAGLAEVAAGKRTSTEFVLSFEKDLGISSTAYGSSQDEASDKAIDQINLDTEAVLLALVSDCPYDLYWYDKGRGMRSTFRWNAWVNSKGVYKVTLDTITVRFPVAYDYVGSGEYVVDKAKMTAVQTALSTIRSIVSSNRGLSDEAKLKAYKDRICALTSYNDEAEGTFSSHYVNPWQLIWVFDNDPSTEVVCEGYAKAFQYLCDLSVFKGPVYCISVSGVMKGISGSGDHMWNIVHMEDGLNYLVDVTNCDEGTVGEGDWLFMKKPLSGDVTRMYRFQCEWGQVSYQYSSDIRKVYSNQDLMLNFTPFRDVHETDYFQDPVIWALENNITKGTSATAFSPKQPCTRAEAVTFLWRANGSKKVRVLQNPFSDITKDAYYYQAVLWAQRNGITQGVSDTEFGPDETCDRGQIVTFLWRTCGKPKATGTVNFKDVDKTAYYYDAVRWAVQANVTQGTDKYTFSPNSECTRAQIVTFLYRAR